MLHKNKRNGLAVLVALAAGILLLACDPPSDDGPSPAKLTKITVSPSTEDIYVATDLQTVPTDLRTLYKAEGTYDDGTKVDITAKVSWKSAAPDVVSIDAAGLATPKAPTGSTKVTASLGGITSNEVTLKVLPLPKTITVSPSTKDIYVATDLRKLYKAEGTYDDGTKADITAKVSWKSAAPDVVSIDAAGLATPKAPTGSTKVTASLGGITSNEVTLNVVLAVCGRKAGVALGTEAGGGINDTDPSNAAPDLDPPVGCLKIREIVDSNDGKTKWFTSSPPVFLLEDLGYHFDINSTNEGDAHGYDTLERSSNLSYSFARFSQTGKNADLTTGVGGQYDRWCKKLNALNFAGQAQWHRTTKNELAELYKSGNSVNSPTGMYARFGWPVRYPYWSSTPDGSSFFSLDLSDNSSASSAPSEFYYVSCVAERP